MNKQLEKLRSFLAGFFVAAIVFAVFFAGFNAVLAWEEPSQPPPQNNVKAPLNIGPDPQTKEGGLGVSKLCFGNVNGADCKASWSEVLGVWLQGTNGIYYNAGNVGIGTVDSADYTLKVEGNVYVGTEILSNALYGKSGVSITSPTPDTGDAETVWLGDSNDDLQVPGELCFGSNDIDNTKCRFDWPIGLPTTALDKQTLRYDGTNANWVVNGALMSDGERVGIGVSNLTQLLEISDSLNDNRTAVIRLSDLNHNPEIQLQYDTTVLNKQHWSMYVNQNDDALRFWSWNGSDANEGDRLTILQNGNVGIGTNNPTSKLEASGVGGTPNGLIKASDSADADYAAIDPNYGLILSRGTAYVNNASIGGDIRLRTSASAAYDITAMAIDGITGNVGIGTTNPTEKLEVVGKVKITDDIKLTNNRSIALDDTTTDTTLLVGNYNGTSFSYNTGQRANLVVEGDVKGNRLCIEDDCKDTWGSIGIGGGGTTNYVPKFTPDGTTLGNSIIYDNGSNKVGILEPNPKSTLQVGGGITINANQTFYWNGYWDGSSFKYAKDDYMGYIQLRGNAAPTGKGDMTFNFAVLGVADQIAATNERMRITNSGNVGIGTNNPTAKLHVKGTNNSSGGMIISGNNSLGNRDRLAIYPYENYGAGFKKLDPGTEINFSNSSDQTELYINASGNVGIGTNAPGYPLHVTDNGNTGVINIDNTGVRLWTGLRLAIDGTEKWFAGINDISDNFIIRKNESFNEVTIESATGNVGIGIGAPTGKLHIAGSANTNQLVVRAYNGQTNANPLMLFEKGDGTDLFSIHSDNPRNIFVGLNSGQSNTIGIDNLSFGYNALALNTTGQRNIAIGTDALANSIEGWANVAIGYEALKTNTGWHNIAIGHGVLRSNLSGQYNVVMGTSAFYYNTSGNENVAIGKEAGMYYGAALNNPLTISNNSIYIGRKASASANNNSNEIVIGGGAVGAGSNSVVLGNDSITKTILKGEVSVDKLRLSTHSTLGSGSGQGCSDANTGEIQYVEIGGSNVGHFWGCVKLSETEYGWKQLDN